MKNFAPILLFLLLLGNSCTSVIKKDEIFHNEQIDPKVRSVISDLDKQVFANMSENNYDALSKLFSDSLLDGINTDFAQKFMPQIQHVIKGTKYRTFDQFYIRHKKENDSVKISGGTGELGYTLKFRTPTKETIISMIIAGDTLNEVMLTLMYQNINGKWKVNHITGEDYSLSLRNAIEQYNYIKSLQKNNFLMDAANTMTLAKHTFTPGGKIFTYNMIDSMNSYYETLMSAAQAHYPFPHIVTEISTKPSIFNIHYEVFNNRFTPMIMYITPVDVADTFSLRKENSELQQRIGTIFPGMDKVNHALIYRAYNDLPDGNNDPKYFGYVQMLNVPDVEK